MRANDDAGDSSVSLSRETGVATSTGHEFRTAIRLRPREVVELPRLVFSVHSQKKMEVTWIPSDSRN